MVAVLIARCGHTRLNLVFLVVRVSVVHVHTLVLSALTAAKHGASVVAVVVSASAAASVVAKSVTAARRPTETTGATSATAISRTKNDTPCNGAQPRPCRAPRMTRRATEQELSRSHAARPE